MCEMNFLQKQATTVDTGHICWEIVDTEAAYLPEDCLRKFSLGGVGFDMA
jgi:hypothetical protein